MSGKEHEQNANSTSYKATMGPAIHHLAREATNCRRSDIKGSIGGRWSTIGIVQESGLNLFPSSWDFCFICRSWMIWTKLHGNGLRIKKVHEFKLGIQNKKYSGRNSCQMYETILWDPSNEI